LIALSGLFSSRRPAVPRSDLGSVSATTQDEARMLAKAIDFADCHALSRILFTTMQFFADKDCTNDNYFMIRVYKTDDSSTIKFRPHLGEAGRSDGWGKIHGATRALRR
jgi:hypothetical protein